MLRIRLFTLAASAAAAMSGASANTPDINLQFFRDLAETRNYTLGQPVSAEITPDNRTVIFLRSEPRDRSLQLFEFDIASGTERELLTPDQLLGDTNEKLSTEEKARRERARVSLRGFTKFDLSDDGTRILVTLSGKLYVIDRKSYKPASPTHVPVIALPGENWIDPKFSPDGSAVAAVKGGEIHIIELESITVLPLTHDATEYVNNGVAEFVAQEEMDRSTGYWWSPDSQWIAYQQNDESGVEVRYVADPLHPEVPPVKFFYPKAGSNNAMVRLGIVSRQGGNTRWIKWNADAFPYLTRVIWKESGAPLCILVQDRAQQNQVLFAVDATTGILRRLVQESDLAWLNLDSTGTLPLWLSGAEQFLWTTEHSGNWQVELRNADGTIVHAVTPPDFIYKKLLFADTTRGVAYVLGSIDPVETHLWKFSLEGKGGTQLTTGFGNHHAVFSKEGGTMVHTYELLNGDRGSEIIDSEARRLAVLPSYAENPHQWASVEITQTESDPRFKASLVRPRNFKSGKKYPVILYVYSGPTSTVVRAGARTYLTDQWMADQEFIVVRIDGRGTPYRGRKWERIVRGNLIDIALQDQVNGLEALGRRYPELDMQRVGIMGWSFGGYVGAMATIRHPEIFRCGVAGAPVVTWENYDTYYTERYLGLPQENPIAYRTSSVLTYVDQLKRPLLIFHGLTDDNVYFQHSLQLTNALYLAGKPYEIVPLLGTHMVSDPVVRLREQERIMEFLSRNLRDRL